MIKKEATSSMRAGAKGINIRISGRLGGAEMLVKKLSELGSISRLRFVRILIMERMKQHLPMVSSVSKCGFVAVIIALCNSI